MAATEDEREPRPNVFVRLIDPLVVLLVKGLILAAQLASRDPGERATNLLRPDPAHQARARNWRAILDWPPGKRVGCFTAVVIGVAVGGAVLWYGLR